MNVLHIASSDSGGACGAAMRIHDCLRRHVPKVNSKALVIWRNTDQYEDVHSIRDSYKGLGKLKLKVIDYSNYIIANKLAGDGAGVIEMNYFFYKSFYRPENHPLVTDWADVLHLHYVNCFINFPSFFSKVKQPIVWSFHDMTPFTGGNCYELGEISKNLPGYRRYLSYKKRYLQSHNVHGHATTNVFRDKAINQYETFSDENCTVIDYPLDTNIFHSYNKVESRKYFQLPNDKKLILFVCADVNSPRKGFSLILENIYKLVEKNIHIAVVGGNSDIIQQHSNIHPLGFIRDPRNLAKLYSAADVFVTPALEEAFGQTTTEALACGLPVVAFNTAGALAQIKHGVNGWVCEKFTGKSLYNGIVGALEADWNKKNIEYMARQRFSEKIVAEKYDLMYREIINR